MYQREVRREERWEGKREGEGKNIIEVHCMHV
jgi:hypothetical protein